MTEENKSVATRFGGVRSNPQSQDIVGGNRPWSVRKSLEYLARQPLNMKNKKNPFEGCLPENPTAPQLAAANILIKATQADMRAVAYITEQLDGKVAQVNINAHFAAIQGMTDEELRRKVDERIAQRAAANDRRGDRSDGGGAGAPGSCPPTIDGEATPVGPTTPSAGV